jgi:hypothetical protein
MQKDQFSGMPKILRKKHAQEYVSMALEFQNWLLHPCPYR